MKMTAFCDIAPCSLVEVDRRFRDAYCLYQQETVRTSETFVYFNETIRRYFPEGCHFKLFTYLRAALTDQRPITSKQELKIEMKRKQNKVTNKQKTKQGNLYNLNIIILYIKANVCVSVCLSVCMYVQD
jgi:hypothetical protein